MRSNSTHIRPVGAVNVLSYLLFLILSFSPRPKPDIINLPIRPLTTFFVAILNRKVILFLINERFALLVSSSSQRISSCSHVVSKGRDLAQVSKYNNHVWHNFLFLSEKCDLYETRA